MNFATLGQSEYRRRLLEIQSKAKIYSFLYLSNTGQTSDPLHCNITLQSPVFLINSRHPLFCATSQKLTGTLYPEVTELICRVPLILFFQMP